MAPTNNKTAELTNEQIVRLVFPTATAKCFSASHDWEVYETSDVDSSYLLGSSANVETTLEQDEADYKSTEEAAWEDAAKYVKWALDILAEAKKTREAVVIHIEHETFATYKKVNRSYNIDGKRYSEKAFLRRLSLSHSWANGK